METSGEKAGTCPGRSIGSLIFRAYLAPHAVTETSEITASGGSLRHQ